jgi:hypothetical protein
MRRMGRYGARGWRAQAGRNETCRGAQKAPRLLRTSYSWSVIAPLLAVETTRAYFANKPLL